MITLWTALVLAQAADSPRRLALVVGSNEGLSAEEPLRYAARDADRVADALVRVGDVRPEDLVLLRNPDASSIGLGLDALVERTQLEPSSVVVVYYSGHASARALHVGGERVWLADVVARLAEMDSRVELLIVDACGSGALTRRKGVVPAEPFELSLADRLDTEGLAILTSSSPGEDAQESERLRGGVFTHHLVAGLLGAADGTGDGLVTLTEAFRYGYDQTVRTTSAAPFLQHPAYRIQLSGKHDLVVSRLDRDSQARLWLDEPGTWLVLGARQLDLVVEIEVEEPIVMALPPGPYLLRRRYRGVVEETRAHLARGAAVRLDGAPSRRISAGEVVRKGYDPERRSAGVLFVGGGVARPFGIGNGPAPHVQIGLRGDARSLSGALRVRLDQQRAVEGALTSHQRAIGLDAELARMQHLVSDRLVLGLGVRAGAATVHQRFDTLGRAPPRSGLVGHVGSVGRLETTVGSRWLLSLSGGVDALAYQRASDEALTAVVRPFGGLEVGVYVW